MAFWGPFSGPIIYSIRVHALPFRDQKPTNRLMLLLLLLLLLMMMVRIMMLMMTALCGR